MQVKMRYGTHEDGSIHDTQSRSALEAETWIDDAIIAIGPGHRARPAGMIDRDTVLLGKGEEVGVTPSFGKIPKWPVYIVREGSGLEELLNVSNDLHNRVRIELAGQQGGIDEGVIEDAAGIDADSPTWVG